MAEELTAKAAASEERARVRKTAQAKADRIDKLREQAKTIMLEQLRNPISAQFEGLQIFETKAMLLNLVSVSGHVKRKE